MTPVVQKDYNKSAATTMVSDAPAEQTFSVVSQNNNAMNTGSVSTIPVNDGTIETAGDVLTTATADVASNAGVANNETASTESAEAKPKQPFYKQKWFVIAAIVLGVAAIGGTAYYFMKKK